MADIIKFIYSGMLPITSTNVYTVPAGKYAVSKSIVISNTSAADVKIRVNIASFYVAHDHVIKAKSTLVIDDLDIPMVPGSWIVLSSAAANSVSIAISGFERDYVAADFPYSIRTGTFSGSMSAGSTNDWIIKSIVICNTTTSVSTMNLKSTSVTIMDSYKLKANDTLILPSLNVYFARGQSLTYSVDSQVAWPIYYALVLEKVVQ